MSFTNLKFTMMTVFLQINWFKKKFNTSPYSIAIYRNCIAISIRIVSPTQPFTITFTPMVN